MGWPKQIVFVRHAESEGNIRTAEERAKFDMSTHSYALTERGKQQAALTGEYLRARFPEFDAYFQSYYTRTKQTLEILYPEAPVFEDARLAEAQRGIWHIMNEQQMSERLPEEIVRKKREGYYHYRPLGGENWPDVELRIHSFLGTLWRDYEDKRVICVVHEHWLILLQRIIHHYSIPVVLEMFSKGTFGNASVTIYESEVVDGASHLVLREKNIVPWEGKL